ncbi:tRNA pseudouridine(55) synthase TruB [Zhaonella formicivorans]|uniref:tRNA pseudouridine(55) synthase TruB n=1 Tax=Zhaonella formicivorans TaxID=2528593 RepID=UPI0010F33EF0|nr:tRNA pseudouridine(55) synthase TruB [Zhaonella formicivorans]
MHGFINVLKPPGMTSHDVVAWMRKLLAIKKIGHAGTLDPAVPGVLVLAVGQATRLVEYVQEHHKSYRCEMLLGLTTDTQDMEGEVLCTRQVQKEHLQNLKNIFSRYIGQISQIPPMVSAVHFQGRRLYELAREGIEVEREPRQVYIYKLEIVEEFFQEPPYRLLFDVTCSKGTYIRTLCHDIGEALGCGAVMSYLLRTASGPFRVEDAWTLEEITKACAKQDFSFLLPPETGITNLPKAIVQESDVRLALNGVKISNNSLLDFPENLQTEELVTLWSPDKKLLAIGIQQGSGQNGFIRIKKVFK